MYQHFLVPLDDTDLAVDIAASALELARKIDARVTFLHVLRDYAATGDGALARALSPAQFAETAAGHADAVLAKAEVAAREAGVPHARKTVISDRPFEAIIETAEALGCDLIFMGSHGRKGLRGMMLGSQTGKVLQHSPVPVLVCTVESNVAGRDMNAAIATIKDEHRSLAAVVHGMRRLCRESLVNDALPDLDVLRASLYYLATFPAKLHHPKEDDWLYCRLLGQDEELDKVITLLQAQHREGEARLKALDAACANLAQGESGLAQFATAVDDFAEGEWEHMRIEETIVLPAAQARLSDTDWREIARAFDENGDPRFKADTEEQFRDMFSRIVRLSS